MIPTCQCSIADLGAATFEAPQKAGKTLLEMGTVAIPFLRTASKEAEDPEVHWTARELILEIEAELP